MYLNFYVNVGFSFFYDYILNAATWFLNNKLF